MSNFYDKVGVCTSVNWQETINHLLQLPGDKKNIDFGEAKSSDERFNEILNNLKKAQFNPHSAEWSNYYPKLDYESEVDRIVAHWLGLTGIHRAWISRTNPGYYAPWHWDIDANEQKYLEKGPIKRFSIFLDAPNKNFAHAFVLEEDIIYNAEQGMTIYWHNYKSWHAGMNGGLYPKFMYHILGW